MAQVIKNQTAYDAKLRRSMRNKARRNGDPMGLLNNNQGGKVDNLLSTYTRAKDRNELMQVLSAKLGCDPEARRLYKQLQNHWYNRTEHTSDYTCDGKPTTRAKEKMVRKSTPLVNSFY